MPTSNRPCCTAQERSVLPWASFERPGISPAAGPSWYRWTLRLSGLWWADRLGVLRSGVLGEFLATRPCGVDYEE
jgi:hypothetical protein